MRRPSSLAIVDTGLMPRWYHYTSCSNDLYVFELFGCRQEDVVRMAVWNVGYGWPYPDLLSLAAPISRLFSSC